MPKLTIAQRRESAVVRFDEPPAPPVRSAAAPYQRLQVVSIVNFRVGDYEVGEGFCPRLWGHPGIRY